MGVPSMQLLAAHAAAGGAAFVPTDITGCVLWLDADDAATITSSGGLVSQWDDKSGNGRNVTATGTTRPTTAATTINGNNVIDFDGSSDYMTSSTLQWVNATTGNFTCFAVTKHSSLSGVRMVVDLDVEGGNRAAQAIRTNGTTPEIVRIEGGVTTDVGSTLSTGTVYVLTSIQRSSDCEMYVNGSSGGATSFSNGSSKATCPLRVGAHQTTVGNYLHGSLAEVVFYNTALNNTDRAAVNDYLNTKWAVY